MSAGSAQKATFRRNVHFGPQGARVSSTTGRIMRTVLLGGSFIILTLIALAFLFGAHAILLGIVFLIAAASVLAIWNRVTSAWSGNCPHCHSQIFVQAPANVQSHGFNCPICNQRIILRGEYFNTVSSIQSVPLPIHSDILVEPTLKRTSYGFAITLGLLALAIVLANAARWIF